MARFFPLFGTLGFRLSFCVGLILLVCISFWGYYTLDVQKMKAYRNMTSEVDRLSNTIRLGTHYAMMLNSRNDLNRIINNVVTQEGIEEVRIFNKQGRIKFSGDSTELDQARDLNSETCKVCHAGERPKTALTLEERVRVFETPDGKGFMGVISPIYNEPGCSQACHVHPPEKKVLGILDVVVSMDQVRGEIRAQERGIAALLLLLFLGSAGSIALFLTRYVNRPIRKLIQWTQCIGAGVYDYARDIERDDEIGQLAYAVNAMGTRIRENQEELKRQRDEFQVLFEQTPCFITVQDRNLKLVKFNKEFADQFSPNVGDFCYQAYKGRSEPCEVCPVVQTFEDGEPHYSEEMGLKKDGSESSWLVRVSPIKNSKGEVTAALEICLDVTRMRALEEEVRKSEENYRTIFNTIPNPVFVLDAETLRILDANQSVTPVYGYEKDELTGTCFTDLFDEKDRKRAAARLKLTSTLDKMRQVRKDGKAIYVNIRVSSSEYLGRSALLATTSDVTLRLMAEQQLIQAGKMATVGEMATGVAHELNQPLSVIKTASSFLRRKMSKREPVKPEILATMMEEIDAHVDRAARIIDHMRQFGRKSDVQRERVDVNDPLRKAAELFQQQLKLREIEVVFDLDDKLPPILADANRLEQVFINLLINARDAIEEKWEQGPREGEEKKIFLKTHFKDVMVNVEVRDTGRGIADSIVDRIFEPFFTTKRVGKGTGLGLSISYGIVKDYNGEIRVESEEGVGSTFIVRFPIAVGA